MAMELGLAVLEEPHLGVQQMPLLLSCWVQATSLCKARKAFGKLWHKVCQERAQSLSWSRMKNR